MCVLWGLVRGIVVAHVRFELLDEALHSQGQTINPGFHDPDLRGLMTP